MPECQPKTRGRVVVYLLVLGACASAEQSGSGDDPLKIVDSEATPTPTPAEATPTPTPAEGDAGKEGGEGP